MILKYMEKAGLEIKNIMKNMTKKEEISVG